MFLGLSFHHHLPNPQDFSWWTVCRGQWSPLLVMKEKNNTDDRRTHWFLISLCTMLCQNVVLMLPYPSSSTHTHTCKVSQGQGRQILLPVLQQRSLGPSSILSHPHFSCAMNNSQNGWHWTIHLINFRLRLYGDLCPHEIMWIIVHVNMKFPHFHGWKKENIWPY